MLIKSNHPSNLISTDNIDVKWSEMRPTFQNPVVGIDVTANDKTRVNILKIK